MRILINTSNIKQSGAFQVTVSFINEILKFENHNYILVVNDTVWSAIADFLFKENVTICKVNFISPLSFGYFQYINTLNHIVSAQNPDCVFSVFGPTYWRPSIPHLAGFAYGWGVNPDSLFVRSLSHSFRFKLYLGNLIKRFFFKRDSDYHVVETDVVKTRLSKYMKIGLNNIYVVGNTYNHFFEEDIVSDKKWNIPSNGFKLLTVSSNFPHKNLKILEAVNNYFLSIGISDIYFIVTLPEEDYFDLFEKNIKNIISVGKVLPSDCPSLYYSCDAMILPTLLESFSACYPEAMKMKKPILTSDLDFAHNLCGDAAIYFDPFNPTQIAEKIRHLRDSKDIYQELVEAGEERVRLFPTATERALKYLKICEFISK